MRLAGFFALLALLPPITNAAVPTAELFAMQTSDGVLLHGLHYRPAQASRAVVIHLPGGPGAFYSAQDMAPLAARLTGEGVHFLSVNLRTAGANGMLFARFEDCAADIGAAMAYADRQGLTDVVLLAHSLSSARAMYFLAHAEHPQVRGLIVSAGITSPYLESQLRWNEGERAQYDAFLAERRRDIDAGRGRQLAAYPWGPGRNFEFSALTWVNVFGNPAESNASTVQHAPTIDVPVLVIHGTADTTAVPKNAELIMAALTRSPRKEIEWIEGGNHLFIGTAEPYGEAVARWVVRLLARPVQPAG